MRYDTLPRNSNARFLLEGRVKSYTSFYGHETWYKALAGARWRKQDTQLPQYEIMHVTRTLIVQLK